MNELQGHDLFSPGLYGMGGSFSGAKIYIKDQKILIGRDPQLCNLVLSGMKISRIHCSIWYDMEEHQYIIEDYSMNGIFRENGERLIKNKSSYFSSGSIIYIATLENRFKLL